ncbi:hypothetical protein VaNZ11_008892, partial [Volvox africanus]
VYELHTVPGCCNQYAATNAICYVFSCSKRFTLPSVAAMAMRCHKVLRDAATSKEQVCFFSWAAPSPALLSNRENYVRRMQGTDGITITDPAACSCGRASAYLGVLNCATGRVTYGVKFKGYDESENIFIDEATLLEDVPELIAQYERYHPRSVTKNRQQHSSFRIRS